MRVAVDVTSAGGNWNVEVEPAKEEALLGTTAALIWRAKAAETNAESKSMALNFWDYLDIIVDRGHSDIYDSEQKR